MQKSTITIDVTLDEQRIPDAITWGATESTVDGMQPAKAIMLNFWDANDKANLRFDLWVKDMMIDEMADFYFQTYMGMADSFGRSTGDAELVEDMKKFARDFFSKFQENQRKLQNKK